jgi:hypothetical protein
LSENLVYEYLRTVATQENIDLDYDMVLHDKRAIEKFVAGSFSAGSRAKILHNELVLKTLYITTLLDGY